jgi:predicted HTH transcriptional regulator
MLAKGDIKEKITQGEGLNVEFKTASDTLPRTVFETICAFLNRKGGYIFLGVKDNGKIEGINEELNVPNPEKVLTLLRENPNITAKEMADITSFSIRTVRNILADLTKENIIERQGADKSGFWIVNNNK